MAFVGIKVSEETKAQWIAAAQQEGVTLSVWLRQAAEMKLGPPVDTPDSVAAKLKQARALLDSVHE